MSTIGGIFRRDDAPLDPERLDRLCQALRRRGPDGGRTSVEGPVAMAHHAFHTAPGPHESLPLRSRRGVLCTWDGRLDNAPELRRLLDLPADAAPGDAAVVLAAHERWPDRFLDLLVGDFALAIWDPRTATLLLARDPFGTRPLFHCTDARRIWWSSRILALLDASGIAAEPDDAWIGAYLVHVNDLERTPFRDVRAVPPGHRLIATRDAVRIEPYYQLPLDREIRHRTDAEYEEHFRELFLDSVRARTRTRGTVFAQLSGGLDSSSVACAAAHLIERGQVPARALRTVSFVYERSRSSDERPFIREVEARLGQPGHHVGENTVVLADLADACPEVPTISHCFRRQFDRMGELMSEHGARVLLTGYAGDSLMWSQVDAPLEIADLLRRGRLGALAHSLRTWHSALQRPYLQLFWQGGVRPLLPAWLRRRLRSRASLPPWIDSGLARRFDLADRRVGSLEPAGPGRPSRRTQLAFLQGDIHTHAWNYCVTGGTVMEVAHPFLHRPLVEMCLSLPLDQLLRGRETRSLQRRALRDLLPERVARRRSKSGPDEAYHRALAREQPRLRALFDGSRAVARGYVDAVRLREALDQARYGLDVPLALLLQVVAVEYWLRALESRHFGVD